MSYLIRMKKIQRMADEMVRQLAREYPVVAVMGPRQSGKTTLCRMAFPNWTYVNLEEPDERRLAKEDPRGFLSRFGGGIILDEVQHVPELLSYVQSLVDGREEMGQFVVTGSSNLLLSGQVSQSLAGRVGILQLLPFCFQELCEVTPDDGRRNLFRTIFAGGYPPIHAQVAGVGRERRRRRLLGLWRGCAHDVERGSRFPMAPDCRWRRAAGHLISTPFRNGTTGEA
jgi:predicted AAA+ superfamily ATPase